MGYFLLLERVWIFSNENNWVVKTFWWGDTHYGGFAATLLEWVILFIAVILFVLLFQTNCLNTFVNGMIMIVDHMKDRKQGKQKLKSMLEDEIW